MVGEDKKPLISVIVPIYNVEKYIRKCLDSLKNQTLKEIEVICIDDGSTDGSGGIAEEYRSDGWPKFRVIHTGNRGLSAARNRGLDEARADWIMFVDSDDWVEPEFCEIPYKAAVENDADLVIFGSVINKKGRTIKCQCEKNRPQGIIDEYAAYEFGEFVVWNKLYKQRSFDTVRFPERRLAEDVATTHKLIHKAEKIVLLSDRFYHYVYRPDSISHTNSDAIRIDGFISYNERYMDLISYGYPKGKVTGSVCASAISILARIDPENDIYVKASNIVNSVKGIPEGLTWKQKIGLIAWKTDIRFFYWLSRAAGRNRRPSYYQQHMEKN